MVNHEVDSSEQLIPAGDGYPLAATLFRPQDHATQGVTIINAATAVPRHFYRHFARFLAEHDHTVITYDLGFRRASGRGGSAPKPAPG